MQATIRQAAGGAPGASSEAESPHDQLSHALKLAGAFKLAQPTRQEVRELVKVLNSDECGAWTDCFEGFRTLDSVAFWMHSACNRKEIMVLHASENVGGLLLRGEKAEGARGSFRWLVPAFATVMTDGKSPPYIELLWVRSNVRRLGVGSLFVRHICAQHPRIQRVKAVLQSAVPFWQSIRVAVPGIDVPVDDPREAHASTQLQAAWRRVLDARLAQRVRDSRARDDATRHAAIRLQARYRQRHATRSVQLMLEGTRRRDAAAMVQRCARRHTATVAYAVARATRAAPVLPSTSQASPTIPRRAPPPPPPPPIRSPSPVALLRTRSPARAAPMLVAPARSSPLVH